MVMSDRIPFGEQIQAGMAEELHIDNGRSSSTLMVLQALAWSSHLCWESSWYGSLGA